MKIRNRFLSSIVGCTIFLMACSTEPQATLASTSIQQHHSEYQIEVFAIFQEPWAMLTLPDDSLLITEKKGKLIWFNPVTKQSKAILGLPEVAYGG